jgi:hypothetical protein
VAGERRGDNSFRLRFSLSEARTPVASPSLTSPHLASPSLTSPHLALPRPTSPYLTLPHLASRKSLRLCPPGTRHRALTTRHAARGTERAGLGTGHRTLGTGQRTPDNWTLDHWTLEEAGGADCGVRAADCGVRAADCPGQCLGASPRRGSCGFPVAAFRLQVALSRAGGPAGSVVAGSGPAAAVLSAKSRATEREDEKTRRRGGGEAPSCGIAELRR